MTEAQQIRASKFLSKHLLHQPEDLGLTLEAGGWVPVSDLILACARKGVHLTREQLNEIVRDNNKQRFSFDETGTRIRANQGHSVEVDLQLAPTAPPATLYHGTGHGSVEAILRDGLVRMGRHHVHLSRDIETATKVGARHGKPVVLRVDAQAMQEAGHTFFVSENGVWLTDTVPARFLALGGVL